MPAPDVLRSIRGTVTQSGANAYTETEINLALSLESRFLFYVTGLQVFFESINQVDDDTIFTWHLSRATKSAVGGFSDSDIIWVGGFGVLTTTSGAAVWPPVMCRELAHPYAIANPSLYFGIDTVGAAVACSASIQLQYYPEKVTQNKFWEAAQTR